MLTIISDNGQTFGNGWIRQFWLETSHEVAGKMRAWTVASGGFIGAQGWFPR